MRNLKRLLTMVMAIAMLMSLMVVGAGATWFGDDKDITHKDAVEKMASLNIINGRDGNFDPNGIVTRAEMAKMICVALNGGNDPKLSPSSIVTFTDTKGHWAEGYIEYCVNMGIVAGLGNNTFGPDQKVTPTQAAKMLLVALGYDAAYEKFTGPTWALATNKIAQGSKGLYDEIQGIDPNAPMTRDAAAQMINNFCSAPMVKYEFGISGIGSSVTGVKQATDINLSTGTANPVYQTVLNKYFKLVTVKGEVTAITYDNSKKEFGFTVKISSTKSETFYSATDYSKFFGMKVEVLVKDKDVASGDYSYDRNNDKIYNVTADDSKLISEGYIGDFSGSGYSAANKEIKFNGVKYDVDNAKVPVYYFGNGSTKKTDYEGNSAVLATASYDGAKVALIDQDNNNKVDRIILTPFNVEKVTYVGTDNVTVTGYANKKFVDITTYDKMAKDDRVCVFDAKYSATDKLTFVKATVTTATVDSTRGTGADAEYKINGSWYYNVTNPVVNLSLGDKIDFVAFGGDIMYAKVVENGATSKDVAIVVNVGKTSGADSNKPEATILMADGVKKTANVSKMNGVDATYGDTNKNAFTPGSTSQVNVEDRVGELVTYVIDKDGKLELTDIAAAGKETGNLAGYDGTTPNNTFYNKEKVGGMLLADTAVVFVLKNNDGTNGDDVTGNDAKVYTGKEMNNRYDTTSFGNWNTTGAAGLYKDINGFDKVCVATINAKDFPTGLTGSNYAYLLADAGREYKNNKYYLTYQMWNGKEIIEASEEDTGSKQSTMLEKTIVSYDNDANGLVKNVTVVPVTTAAIKGWEEGKTTGDIAFTNSLTATTTTTAKIDSDTIVIFVNVDEKKGELNREILKTSDINGDGDITSKDANARYYAVGSDNTVKVLMIDTSDKMKATGSTTVQNDTVKDPAELAALFTSYNTITVAGTYTPTGDFKVPTGKTLIANGLNTNACKATVETDATLTVNGSATVDAAVTVDGSLKVDGTLTASANINGGGTMNVKAVTAGGYQYVLVATTVTDAFTAAGAETLNGDITFNSLVTTGANALTVNGKATLKAGATLNTGSVAVGTAGEVVVAAGTVDNASLITGTGNAKVAFSAGVTITNGATLYYTAANTDPATTIAKPTAGQSYVWSINIDTDDTNTAGWLLQP